MDKTLLVINTNLVMSDNTRESLQDAARRWNCDYVEFRDAGDFDYHGAALKLKAFHICNHDRIFVIDSDTVIRHDTPSPFECCPPEDFGAVKNMQPHHPPIYCVSNIGIALRDLHKIVNENNITEPVDIDYLANNFFNSGVVVLTREHHEEVLDYAFDLFVGAKGVQWWDQLPLNVAVLLKLNEYRDLGQGWNYMFPQSFHKMNAYIYHFAGNPSRYDILKMVNWRA
jgi:lipopolysaccharide biosynthesis glycosyltransferase